MENQQEQKSELIKVKAPGKELLKYYATLYERNQSKWIRRSSLEPEHLGSEFVFEDKNLKLEGSVDALLMLVSDSEGNYYRMNCNKISELVTGKR